MIRHFLRLQWKSFIRSASFGKSLGIKLIMGFSALYMLGSLLLAGGSLYYILQDISPEKDPLLMVSGVMVYWILIEFFIRYFMQKLPVIDSKPFLALPIKKSSITHYILVRSGLSFYNLLSLFFFLPFAIVLVLNGYPSLPVTMWIFAILGMVLSINYINFLVNKSNAFLGFIVALMLGIAALDYSKLLPVKEKIGAVFYWFYEYPLFAIVPSLLAIVLYYVNYVFLRKKLYLDASLKVNAKQAETVDLSWTKRFGSVAPFMQLDLKLLWRNKRTKTQVILSFAMVLYGLLFYGKDSFGSASVLYVVIGILMTGMFLANFGQFIPAWDSEYYGLMMSQNIPMRKYLESKAVLISASVLLMFLLSIPYLYYGWKILAINASCAIYNFGINVPLVLYFGSFNKKRIDLTASALGNTQGISAIQFLMMIPIMGIPSLLYFVFKILFSFEVALGVLLLLGILGIIFRNQLLNLVTEAYRTRKYGMLAGFKQKNG